MTKEIRSSNDEGLNVNIRPSSFFRHQSFVISHFVVTWCFRSWLRFVQTNHFGILSMKLFEASFFEPRERVLRSNLEVDEDEFHLRLKKGVARNPARVSCKGEYNITELTRSESICQKPLMPLGGHDLSESCRADRAFCGLRFFVFELAQVPRPRRCRTSALHDLRGCIRTTWNFELVLVLVVLLVLGLVNSIENQTRA